MRKAHDAVNTRLVELFVKDPLFQAIMMFSLGFLCAMLLWSLAQIQPSSTQVRLDNMHLCLDQEFTMDECLVIVGGQ